MRRAFKTLVLVVLLTALIWAWAEQSQTRTLSEQMIELTVDVPPGTGFAVRDPETGVWGHRVRLAFTADFNGQQGGISQLSQMITRGEFPLAHSLRISERLHNDTSDAVHTVHINLAEVLNNQSVLDRFHVIATSAIAGNRPVATVEIGRLKEYKLPIRVQVSDLTGGEPKFKGPAEAAVTLPAPLCELLKKAKRHEIVAEVFGDVGLEGEQTAVLAREIEGYAVHPTPERTTFTREIKEVETRFEDVPVKRVFPADFPLQRYALKLDPFQLRKAVTVYGPAGKAITAADVTLQLVFELDDTKPTSVELSRDIGVILPPGFHDAKVEPDKTVKFNFVELKDATPP